MRIRLRTPVRPDTRPDTRLGTRLRGLVVTACALAVVASPALVLSGAATATTTPPALQLGVYTNPGAKNVAGAAAFSTWSGARIGRALEFLSHTSWLDMTRIGWVLTPYTGSGYQLELSVPMVTDDPGTSLAACASGAYDATWRSIATSLVGAQLADTEIRPGWEMNGSWFRWSASGRTGEYKSCFQHLVTAMRSVPGQRLTFTFSPGVGANAVPAELAYPGDAYVDTVSLDIYDLSWAWYPVPAGMTTATAQTKAWTSLKSGDHGLDFWTAFAAAHAKPLGISEWGLTWRSDGHGGGDDPAFVDRMFDWATDPANNVRYLNYFNSPDSAAVKHDLMGPASVFPQAATRFRARSHAVAPLASPTGSAVATPVPATSPTAAPTTSPTASPTASPSTSPTTSPSTSPTTGPTSTAVSTPPPTTAPLTGLRSSVPPSVVGTARLGARLRAGSGRWRPAPSAVRFQWFRDARPVAGATGSSHRVVGADLGHRLRVRVTARRTGWAAATAWSRATARTRR